MNIDGQPIQGRLHDARDEGGISGKEVCRRAIGDDRRSEEYRQRLWQMAGEGRVVDDSRSLSGMGTIENGPMTNRRRVISQGRIEFWTFYRPPEDHSWEPHMSLLNRAVRRVLPWTETTDSAGVAAASHGKKETAKIATLFLIQSPPRPTGVLRSDPPPGTFG